jgi:molybdopterin-guanine dinucleotide biosynthesis protein A
MLAILAGGESRRMGRPKAELRVDGRPILEYLLDRFAWPGPTLLVTAPGREHPQGWDLFDREASDVAAGEGPLRGILTALEVVPPGTTLIVATCDMPGFSGAQLHWLAEALSAHRDAHGMLLRRAGRIEPFPSVFRAAALPLLRDQLSRGRRAVHGLASLDGFDVVDAPGDWGEEVWMNLNEPADFERFVGGTR